MAEIEKILGNMADRLQVAEEGLKDAKAEVAAVKTDLVSAKAETMQKLENLTVLAMAFILSSRLCDICAEVGVVDQEFHRSFKELFDQGEFERFKTDAGFASDTQALHTL